jgi:quercetin dioxygenase-like cupin family protein
MKLACKIMHDQAVILNLPGRLSRQIASGGAGAQNITLRLVEISASTGGEQRKLHYHPDVEECIYVLEGQGRTETDVHQYDLVPGDTLIIPPNERHRTINTGDSILKLLCFFPTGTVKILGENSII